MEEKMEVSQENISKMANALRMEPFNKYMLEVQNLEDVVKDLMLRHPEAENIEELCEIFEREQEELMEQKGKENPEGQEDRQTEDEQEEK